MSTTKNLTQAQFDQGVAKWLGILASGDTWRLKCIFQLSLSDERMVNVTFPVDQMASLVSTPGGYQIQARFLVLNNEDRKGEYKGEFTIVLYATDVNKKRVSGYYRSTPGSTEFVSPKRKACLERGENTLAVADSDAGDDMWPIQVPYSIVRGWLDAWKGPQEGPEPELNPQMFANSYGLLQGYTFTFGDFVEPMFNKKNKGDYYLGIDLGLHDYYNTEVEAPSYVFGLALRLYHSDQEAHSKVSNSENAFYDMSMPCPPGF